MLPVTVGRKYAKQTITANDPFKCGLLSPDVRGVYAVQRGVYNPLSQAVLPRGGRQRGRVRRDLGREARRGQPRGRQDRQGGGPLLQADGGRRGAAQQ